MPLYEYECQSCHRRLEKIHQKFSDPPLEVCPHCGGRLQKLVSSPAFQFKGSGWYATDYARKSEKPASEGAAKDAPDPKAGEKSDTDASKTSDKPEKGATKPSTDASSPPSSSTKSDS